MNRKKLCSLLIIAGVIVVVSCIVVRVVTRNNSSDYEKLYAVYASTIQKNDCYLCGNNPNSPITSYLGENNIGIINLNTFECFRFEVNRYNEKHELIEKLVKYGNLHGWGGDENTGSTYDYDVYCNKGYISATLRFNDNSDLQLDRIQTFLCSDCLETVMKDYWSDERHWDIALIDFKNREINSFNQHITGTYMNDYYISMRYNDEHDSLNLLAFFCPDRYSEYDYDPNLTVTDEIMQYCIDNDFAFTLNNEVIEFLSGFKQIGGISYSDKSVTFRNESFIGSKELTINKDGTYDIFDMNELMEDSQENTEELLDK